MGVTFDTPLDADATDVLRAYSDFGLDLTAAQVAGLMLTSVGKPRRFYFPEVSGRAPPTPNSWTDGSLTSPSSGFAITTFGVWHPERNQNEPCTDELTRFLDSPARRDRPNADDPNPLPQFYRKQVDLGAATLGVAIAGMSLGTLTSSLRAELIGLLVGMTCPRPLHVGTDSLSMVKKLETLTDPQRHWRQRRPWSLIKDGDLWEQAVEGWRTRGQDTTRITWGRSHQGFSAIAWHGADPVQVSQNAIADDVASRGASSQGWLGQERLLKHYTAKRQSLVHLLIAIHRLVVDTLKAEMLLRQPDKITAKHDTKTSRASAKTSERILPPEHTPHTPPMQGVALTLLDVSLRGLSDCSREQQLLLHCFGALPGGSLVTPMRLGLLG